MKCKVRLIKKIESMGHRELVFGPVMSNDNSMFEDEFSLNVDASVADKLKPGTQFYVHFEAA